MAFSLAGIIAADGGLKVHGSLGDATKASTRLSPATH